MKVKVCSAVDSDYTEVDSELEQKIQQTLDEMLKNGFYLQQIKYSSSSCFNSYYDSIVYERSAVLLFDKEK